MYNELLEQTIIPEIERENDDELSTEELQKVFNHLDEAVESYNDQIQVTETGSGRQELCSQRKLPKQYLENSKILSRANKNIKEIWKYSENATATLRPIMTLHLCA